MLVLGTLAGNWSAKGMTFEVIIGSYSHRNSGIYTLGPNRAIDPGDGAVEEEYLCLRSFPQK